MQGRNFRRFKSAFLGNSGAKKPLPPISLLGPKDGIIADYIGVIIKLVLGAHLLTREVKIWGNRKKIGLVARSCTVYFKYPFFKII